jgi:hypothetical protein
MSMWSRRLASRFEALAETVLIAELSLLALGAALLAFAVT